MNNYDLTIPHILDTIPNSPSGNQLPSQAKNNLWILEIDIGDPIISKGELEEIKQYQTYKGKYKVRVRL